MAAPTLPLTATEPTSTALLDLPDDLLTRVLDPLVETGSNRRALRISPPAFALATTCTRLYRLLGTMLHTVDALRPDCYERQPQFQFAGPSGAHLAMVTRVAGSNLHVLRLPPHCKDVDRVLDGLAERCPELRELAYSSSHADWRIESALFKAARALRAVHIFDPTRVIASVGCLEDLERLVFTGLRPSCWLQVAEVLRTVGKKLRLLRIGIELCGVVLHEEDCEQNPMWGVSRFAEYLSARNSFVRDLPVLNTLDIGTSDPLLDLRDHVAVQNLKELISALSFSVSVARGQKCEVGSATCLRKIILRVPIELAERCLSLFQNFINDDVVVEMHFAGMAIEFSAPDGTETMRFKALQVSESLIQCFPEPWNEQLRSIERLDVGTVQMADLYSRDADVREKVVRMVSQAGLHLQHVCVPFYFRSPVGFKRAFRYVADVLEVAPNVASLEISCQVVDYATWIGRQFQMMMSMLCKLRVVRLTTSAEAFCDQLGFQSNLLFVHGLPGFLSCLASSCPKLECILMDVLVVDGRHCPHVEDHLRRFQKASANSLRAGLEAVDELEKALPCVDAGSIRKQLLGWLDS